MTASFLDRVLHFKKSELLIFFVLVILTALVYFCLPYIDPDAAPVPPASLVPSPLANGSPI